MPYHSAAAMWILWFECMAALSAVTVACYKYIGKRN